MERVWQEWVDELERLDGEDEAGDVRLRRERERNKTTAQRQDHSVSFCSIDFGPFEASSMKSVNKCVKLDTRSASRPRLPGLGSQKKLGTAAVSDRSYSLCSNRRGPPIEVEVDDKVAKGIGS